MESLESEFALTLGELKDHTKQLPILGIGIFVFSDSQLYVSL